MRERSYLIFGEILFDIFPDGSAFLGGAPFNVAWHLKGFGMEPLMISRLGDDELGRQALKKLKTWGLRGDLIQIDKEYPTGQVRVHLTEHGPKFDILPNVAYDRIQLESLKLGLNSLPTSLKPTAIYCGTLAARSPISRRTLLELLKLDLPTMIDVNLRPPHYTIELVDELLRLVARRTSKAWCKLNEDELNILEPAESDLLSKARSFKEKYNFDVLLVTLGAKGAIAIDNQDVYSQTPKPVENFIDSVGAGDGFAAVSMLGMNLNWSLKVTLERAVEFASVICETRGALIYDPELYAKFRRTWKLEN